MAVTLKYTDPALVADVRRTADVPRSGQTASGYGGKIPTSGMVRYGTRWHRVYVMIWSNSGTAYILSKGERLILDPETTDKFSSV
ncbi:hypothetical protein ORV05_04870 [Amycolatopsis cynarae]|uniref:Uncharacterized protein n=1 Tax=Amycolatopsis cynarae TaxID=2995223 RepID=A0ABY7B5B5_9PSEU|nr:hypothetical protein [Amycolatopsis sp. HUAS 11-8]WAL67124.1 hypothetical protein ORV05_04870 [Amycolatopsis sp. HUAS 11-8]